MTWHSLPVRTPVLPERDANYRLDDDRGLPHPQSEVATLDRLVGPYADVFAYSGGRAGDAAVLIEGMLRIECCSALIEKRIPAIWALLGSNSAMVAEDANKQRVDRLFGLDGEAGLLGALKQHRRVAANALPTMSGAARAEFLADLIAFADALLPSQEGLDLWAWRPALQSVQPSATLALPVYLQALALVVLVREWIGGLPGSKERAALARQRGFLTGDGVPTGWSIAARFLGGETGPAACAVAAAARALKD